MSNLTVAKNIVKILAQSGVKRIYGIIGDSLNQLGNAVRENEEISWISVRHEESGAFACQMEAFLTGELCVCAGSSGPGSVHLINGLYEANRNNVPVLAIVSDIPSSQSGLEYFQATNPMLLYKDCSIFCERLSSREQMPRIFEEAMSAAISKKGVAVIIIPEDVLSLEIPESPYTRKVVAHNNSVVPDVDSVNKLADLINYYDKIAIYCGIGAADAKNEVLALADKINAPVIHTMRSKYVFDFNNPNNVGINGWLSMGESHYALDNCNVLIMLGNDFPFNIAIPTSPLIAQVDINGEHLGRRCALSLGVVGDVKSTLEKLFPLIDTKEEDEFLKDSLKHYNETLEKRDAELEVFANENNLEPQYLTSIINKYAQDDAIVIVDVGLNDVWAARYIDGKNRIICGSFKHGTMAAAMPSAIGAKFAYPKRQVVVLAGDGGVSMLFGDLMTIANLGFDVKIVVYNNGELGFIRKEALMEDIIPFSIELKNPDFAKIAEEMGYYAVTVKQSKGLEGIIENAFSIKKPVLINALTNPASIG